MMKKINDLKKINKYDESVVKESEIDELYSRYIKVRLACIDPWFILINNFHKNALLSQR